MLKQPLSSGLFGGNSEQILNDSMTFFDHLTSNHAHPELWTCVKLCIVLNLVSCIYYVEAQHEKTIKEPSICLFCNVPVRSKLMQKYRYLKGC